MEDSTAGLGQTLRTARLLLGALSFHGVSDLCMNSLACRLPEESRLRAGEGGPMQVGSLTLMISSKHEKWKNEMKKMKCERASLRFRVAVWRVELLSFFIFHALSSRRFGSRLHSSNLLVNEAPMSQKIVVVERYGLTSSNLYLRQGLPHFSHAFFNLSL